LGGGVTSFKTSPSQGVIQRPRGWDLNFSCRAHHPILLISFFYFFHTKKTRAKTAFDQQALFFIDSDNRDGNPLRPGLKTTPTCTPGGARMPMPIEVFFERLDQKFVWGFYRICGCVSFLILFCRFALCLHLMTRKIAIFMFVLLL